MSGEGTSLAPHLVGVIDCDNLQATDAVNPDITRYMLTHCFMFFVTQNSLVCVVEEYAGLKRDILSFLDVC